MRYTPITREAPSLMQQHQTRHEQTTKQLNENGTQPLASPARPRNNTLTVSDPSET